MACPPHPTPLGDTWQVDGDALGDLGALKNPDCVEPLRDAIAKSGKKTRGAPAGRAVAQPQRHVPSVDELTATVLEAVRSLTGSPSVTPEMPLMDIGLDSLGATVLTRRRLQPTHSPTPVCNAHTTPDRWDLCAHLSLRSLVSALTCLCPHLSAAFEPLRCRSTSQTKWRSISTWSSRRQSSSSTPP